MAEGIAWLVILGLIALVFIALIRDSNRKSRRTSAEFERDLAEQKDTMLKAGMLQLDQFVGDINQKKAAVEFLKSEEQGQTKTGSKGDDEFRTRVE
jgi:hypothetical protein